MLKICMVGMGSIGMQHTRNLSCLLNRKGISFQIDALRMLNKPLPDDVKGMVSYVYRSFDALPCNYDIIFLNTPTSLHFEHLTLVLNHAQHIFIEKPVFDKFDYPWRDLPWHKNGVYYVACPLRYHSVINYLVTLVKSLRIFSVRSICSSYLPDWRPGQDYRKIYSARSDQGGGVRIDLIHEWDYLCYLFGRPASLQHFFGTFSDLEISSEDLAVYIAQYPDKIVSLHLDYFGRTKRREIELFTSEDVIICDLYNQTVRFTNKDETVSLPQSRAEMQQAELFAFLSMMSGKIANHNTISDAIETLRITLGVVD